MCSGDASLTELVYGLARLRAENAELKREVERLRVGNEDLWRSHRFACKLLKQLKLANTGGQTHSEPTADDAPAPLPSNALRHTPKLVV